MQKQKKAEVEINSNGNTMRIMVKDDGIGFDPESVVQSRDSKKGFGLFSIQERLHFLGGELSIESKPSRGTTVFLMVPLTRNQKLSGEGETDGHKNSAGG